MIEVTLPDDAWEGVEPGTEALLDQWLVCEGDRVEAGQVVAKVVLVKANLVITSPAHGVIERILVSAEQTFAKGRPLATLREA